MRIEVIVNANARRGSQESVRKLQRTLPSANIRRTVTLEDVSRADADLQRTQPDLVLVAGGDGSALSLLNALRRVRSGRTPTPRVGLLRLGTGNGWARSVGAPRLGRGLERLRDFLERGFGPEDLPCARFDLIDVGGMVTHFAGTGWDAELIDDFHAQKELPSLIPRGRRMGLAGYLNGLFSRTVPRNLKLPRVEIELTNTGESALGIDPTGKLFPASGAERGAVLYRGPVSICGVGTSTQWGFGFRAFPFARLAPGRFNLRMYVGSTRQALAKIPQLWTGKHPLPHMLTWMLTSCRVTFSRPVPLQAGGDVLGHRDSIDYRISEETVRVLDWRALGRQLEAPERLLKDAFQETIEPALLRRGILANLASSPVRKPHTYISV